MSEICADCGATFAEPSDLVAHMREAHAGGDPEASLESNPYSHTPGLTCSLCGETFPTRRELAEHALRPHATTRRRFPSPRPASS